MVPGPVGSDQANARFAVCSLCIATFPRASANTSTCYTRLMPGLSGLRLTFPRTNGRLPWLLWTIFRWYETNKWPSENRRAAWQAALPSGAEKEGEGEREREFSGNENSRILNPSQSNHVCDAVTISSGLFERRICCAKRAPCFLATPLLSDHGHTASQKCCSLASRRGSSWKYSDDRGNDTSFVHFETFSTPKVCLNIEDVG